MLSVDGDAGAAAEARIQTGWNKFRQLVPMLTNQDYIIDKCKKLNSLKHRVRSQITRLKLQKSFCDLEHGVLL